MMKALFVEGRFSVEAAFRLVSGLKSPIELAAWSVGRDPERPVHVIVDALAVSESQTKEFDLAVVDRPYLPVGHTAITDAYVDPGTGIEFTQISGDMGVPSFLKAKRALMDAVYEDDEIRNGDGERHLMLAGPAGDRTLIAQLEGEKHEVVIASDGNDDPVVFVPGAILRVFARTSEQKGKPPRCGILALPMKDVELRLTGKNDEAFKWNRCLSLTDRPLGVSRALAGDGSFILTSIPAGIEADMALGSPQVSYVAYQAAVNGAQISCAPVKAKPGAAPVSKYGIFLAMTTMCNENGDKRHALFAKYGADKGTVPSLHFQNVKDLPSELGALIRRLSEQSKVTAPAGGSAKRIPTGF